MTWTELATENLRAARTLLRDGHPRASLTRNYYAAYCAVTSELHRRGMVSFGQFNNPSHQKLGSHIIRNIGLNTVDATNIAGLVASLRYRREDADYRPYVSVGTTDAQDAIRDAELIAGAFSVPLY